MYQFGDNVKPGWRVHRGDDGVVRIVLNGSSVLNVTTVDGSPVGRDVLFAMAAAPELLDALKSLFADWVTLVGEDLKEQSDDVALLWRCCEDAIAKAEGRGGA